MFNHVTAKPSGDPARRDRRNHRVGGCPLGPDRRGRVVFLGLFIFLPLAIVFSQALRKGVWRLLGKPAPAGRAGGDPPDAAGGGHCRAVEPGLRRGRGLGHRQVRVRGQEPADHADRSAVFGLAGGGGFDLCAALRIAGIAGTVAGAARPANHFRGAGHRSGDDLRDFSLRGARADSADAGAGEGRGRGGAGAGRQRLANIFPRDPAQHQMGTALRRDSLQRPRDGRVRRGVGGLRAHSRTHQHHAAAHRNSVQRISIRRRLRGGLAAGAAGAGDAGGQDRSSNGERGASWRNLRAGTEKSKRHEHRSAKHHQEVRPVHRAGQRRV